MEYRYTLAGKENRRLSPVVKKVTRSSRRLESESSITSRGLTLVEPWHNLIDLRPRALNL